MAGEAGKRHLCSELVRVEWRDEFDEQRCVTANLEEIWPDGAQVLLEIPVRKGTPLRIATRGPVFPGTVTRCEAHPLGYFVDVVFDADVTWSPDHYRPQHLLDPEQVQPRQASQELQEKNALELARLAQVIQKRQP